MTKADLGRLIPHWGTMCLLDRAEQWDDIQILCRSGTHRDPANPLRRGDRLEALCGLEYAAQAMAVHVGLLEERERKHTITVGYLGAVNNLILGAGRLDDVKDDLTIQAARLVGQGSSFIYTFRVSAGPHELLSGRASIFLKYREPQP